MAISRHSEEWKRTIFCALAAGVTFQEFVTVNNRGRKNYRQLQWIAEYSDMRFVERSKYTAACAALSWLMGRGASLPDAANLTKNSAAGRPPVHSEESST